MNKIKNKISFCLFIFIFFFLFVANVYANSINKIEMDVYVDSNGNAHVTEVWSAILNQGTEGYRSLVGLGNMSITDFAVADDTGTTYEYLSFWNVNASFDDKAYKNGIRSLSNGIELCWGISQYGTREYTLTYTINNFVTQYIDTQGIYFNFLDLGRDIGSAKVTIRSDIPFSLDNARIWAFGNNGTIVFSNGTIVLDSQGSLSSSQYMSGLVRFEANLFHTSNTSNQSFDQIYDSIIAGVDDEDEDNSTWVIPFILFLPLSLLLNPAVWIAVYIILRVVKGRDWIWGSSKKNGDLIFQGGNTLPDDKDIPYFRDIPCNKNLARAYWVAYQYHVVSSDTLKEGIIGAILLKWVKEKRVTVSKTKKGLFDFKDNNYAIDLSQVGTLDDTIENDLLQTLKKASGSNNILEAKEFEKWCKKNYHIVDDWFRFLLSFEQTTLEKEGLITSISEETTGMFGRKKTVTVKSVNEKLREEAIQLKGLMKFLLDFSRMPERQYFEVVIWEEYLIFAQLLGIADKVEEQFSKLYPKFREISSLDLNITTIAVRNMVHIGYVSFEKGKASSYHNRYSGSSRSSGGGGHSYSSGGRSAPGSSGGGFR